MGRTVRSVVVAAAMGGSLLWGQRASACDCVVADVPTAWRLADRVFTGRVTAIRHVDSSADREAPTVVEFAVASSWKGVTTTTTTLHTQENHTSCDGYNFTVGETYLVFAAANTPEDATRHGLDPASRTYGVSLCGGTGLLKGAGRDRERHVRFLSRK